MRIAFPKQLLTHHVRSTFCALTTPSDPARGFDQGVFVPLLVAFSSADIPCVQLSLLRSMCPDAHLDLGAALAPLRQEGVLIIGSGLTHHDLRRLVAIMGGAGDAAAMRAESEAFDAWLADTLLAPPRGAGCSTEERRARLARWAEAPHGACLSSAPAPPAISVHADAVLPCFCFAARASHPGREAHLLPLLVAAGAAGFAAAERPYAEALGGIAHNSAFEWRDSGVPAGAR